MKPLLPYAVAFVLLVVLAWTLAGRDDITPAIVEARSETSIGVVRMDVLNQSMTFILKLIGGATLAGLLTVAWTEGRKYYRQVWLATLNGRRVGARSAPVQQPAPQAQPLRREDILMALIDGQRKPRRVRPAAVSEERNDYDDL